ncbi:MAG: DUF4296 domain-containing protein [bacterium]
MKTLRLFTVTLIFLMGILPCCTNQPKQKVLEPEQFAQIYTEMILLSVNQSEPDSMESLQIVLDKNNVSREEFEASMTYFNSQPELWLAVFTKVEEKLKKDEEAANKNNGLKLAK